MILIQRLRSSIKGSTRKKIPISFHNFFKVVVVLFAEN